MRSDEEIADEVLRRTLVEVKAARTRRRAVKGAVAGLVVLTLGVILFQRPAPLAATGQVVVVEAARPPQPGVDEAIAVMVWKDGLAHLEWINLRDLGTVELQFSLDPVIAFVDDGS